MSPETESDLQSRARALGAERYVHAWAPQDFDILPFLRPEDPLETRFLWLDPDAFGRDLERFGYRDSAYWQQYIDRHGPSAQIEKALEHYVSIQLMKPREGEVLIDIASCESPFPDLLTEHFGIDAYRQDYIYPPGVEGHRIGGDAAALPIDDNFADLMTLHCSFEHLEGSRDTCFLYEAQRVLRPGGRLCILPFYVNAEYAIQTDPQTWSKWPVSFEPEALLYLAKDWGESHARLYDPEHFRSRILDHLGDLKLTLYVIENALDIDPGCHLRYAALFTKPQDSNPPHGTKPEAAHVRKPVHEEQIYLYRNIADLRYRLEDLQRWVDDGSRRLKAHASAEREYTAEIDRRGQDLDAALGFLREAQDYAKDLEKRLESSYADHQEAETRYAIELETLHSAVTAQTAQIEAAEAHRAETAVQQAELAQQLDTVHHQHASACEDYASQIATLSKELESAWELVRERDDHLARLHEELEEGHGTAKLAENAYETEIERLGKELTRVHAALEESGAQHQLLHSALEEAQRDQAHLQDEVPRAHALLQEQGEQIQELNQRQQALQSALDEAYRSHAKAVSAYEAESERAAHQATQELQDRDAQIAELEHSSSERQRQHAAEMQDAHDRHEKARSQYEEEIDLLTSEVARQERSVDELADRLRSESAARHALSEVESSWFWRLRCTIRGWLGGAPP